MKILESTEAHKDLSKFNVKFRLPLDLRKLESISGNSFQNFHIFYFIIFDDRFFNDMKGFEYLTLYYCLEKSSYIYYKSKFAKFSKTYGMRQKEMFALLLFARKNHVIMRSAASIPWWQPLISFERFFRGWNMLRARLFFRTFALVYILYKRVCLREIKEIQIEYVCQTLISMRC